MRDRMSKDVYFMAIAILASEQSTCIRRKIGCVAVRDKRVLATGYNGTVSGTTHCTKETCYRMVHNIPSGQQLDMCRALHAEENVILQAASPQGTDISNSDIYITTYPCFSCLKKLAQIGVHRIVTYGADYPQNELAKELCNELGIRFECPWTDEERQYLQKIHDLTS